MDSDSATTKRQKTHLAEQFKAAFGFALPHWFLEGTTLADLREVRNAFEYAHNRYTASGRIPRREEPSTELNDPGWHTIEQVGIPEERQKP